MTSSETEAETKESPSQVLLQHTDEDLNLLMKRMHMNCSIGGAVVGEAGARMEDRSYEGHPWRSS